MRDDSGVPCAGGEVSQGSRLGAEDSMSLESVWQPRGKEGVLSCIFQGRGGHWWVPFPPVTSLLQPRGGNTCRGLGLQGP